jgi:peptidoglycan/xylan/chitin deacetylase (PgdA/CDA1 family)
VLSTAGASLFVGLAGCTSITGSGDEQTTTSTGGENTPTSTTASETGTPTNETTTGGTSQIETSVLDDFEDLSNWKLKNGKMSTASDAYGGSQAMQLTRKGGEPLVTRPVDIDLKNKNLSMAVRTDANINVVFDVIAHAPDAKNQIVLTEGVRVPPGHSWLRIDPGVTNVKGLPDLTSVKRLSIRVRGGNSGAKIWIDDLRTVPSPDKPAVVMTFDDSLESHYAEAFQYMKKKDMPGSVATITGKVGQKGSLSLNQMKEMKNAGWEFASHSRTPDALLNASRLEVERDVVQAKEWLVNNGFETGAQYFVYPYGQYTKSLKSFISNHHKMAYRYMGTGSAGSGYVTEAMTASRGDGSNLEPAKKMVDIATLYNDIEIFTFHDIANNPDDNLAISPTEFKELVDYVDSKKNVETLTLSQVEQRFLTDVSPP